VGNGERQPTVVEGPVEERRPTKGGHPLIAKPGRSRAEQKIIRFSDLQDVTTAPDEGYVEEYTERGEQWYEEDEEPEKTVVPRNVAGLAKRSGKSAHQNKNIKPGDWKFI
jgi:hypothetical protein